MKPVIRISMIPCINVTPFHDGLLTRRKDGTDVWVAKLSYCTGEGQWTQKTFTSYLKRDALQKAYDYLNELLREEWYPQFFNEQLAIYCDYFTPENELEMQFAESMDKVWRGEMTRELFKLVWEEKLRLHKSMLASQNTPLYGDSITWGAPYDPRMDERCDPVDTKRWWQFWK